ncbi:MAG: hypothetical protein BA869_02925 [Desulfuromonadales bacterium C00003107]|nr:MAG: hypothetical protein BA869_02925 [Desulfuromonadales bacterium C00003107]
MSATGTCIDSVLERCEDPRVLLRKVLWLGLLCLAALLLLATYGVYRAYSWRLIESAHTEAQATCQVLLVKEKKHLLAIDNIGKAKLNLSDTEQANFEKRLQKYFKPFAVDTIRIWDLRRQVINFTTDKNTHRVPTIPAALDQALAGQGISLLGKATDVSFEAKSLWGPANQVISYLPIWGKNKEVLGAIEIRRSVKSYREEIRRGVVFFFLLLGVALLALFSCVYLLVAKGANRLAKTQQVLRWLATTDPLTGLFNRREILARASDSFSKEKDNNRHKTPVNFGLLMLDFDNFKEINDNYGHPVGDQVLQELATRLRATLRPYDILGRIGGEEFLVVLPNSKLKQCQEIAERLCKTVREQPFEFDGLRICGSISIGGATAHPLDQDLEALLQRADERLYKAKNRGKDCAFWPEDAVSGSNLSSTMSAF